jgi:hypothetical protein
MHASPILSMFAGLSLMVLASGVQAGEALPALAARALDFPLACCTAPPGWQKLDAAVLNQERGGYDLPSGLTMSLGIERLVSVNGQLLTQTSFNIANLSSISGDEARLARDAIGSARLLQNGSGNIASLGAGVSAGTFVQNTLNDQTIGTQTIISANVNSASLLKDLNFNSGLRDATIRGIPVH